MNALGRNRFPPGVVRQAAKQMDGVLRRRPEGLAKTEVEDPECIVERTATLESPEDDLSKTVLLRVRIESDEELAEGWNERRKPPGSQSGCAE